MSLIAEHLKPNLIFDLRQIDSPAELFQFIGEKLKHLGIEPKTIISALNRRETLGSTGIGHGVALPHAIIPDNLPGPLFVFVRVRKGVNWNAIDAQPVKLICLIIAGENQRSEYLKLLANVSRIVANPYLRHRLLKVRSVSAIRKILRQEPTPGIFAQYRMVITLLVAIVATYFLSRFFFPLLKLPVTGIYEKLGYTKFNSELWLSREALTTAVFLGMILGTIFFWRFRVALAATSIALLLLLRVMDIESAVEYMSIPTVIFIMAMMALIKWLENSGVFPVIVAAVARRVGNAPGLTLVVLMLFSIVLSGFAGEVSGILVTFGLALEIAQRARHPHYPTSWLWSLLPMSARH